jgi:hypothetical protein
VVDIIYPSEEEIMIDGNGIRRETITAAQARQVSSENPWNENDMVKADIMARIQRDVLMGRDESWLQGYRCYYDGKSQDRLPQPIIDWLVGLGYVVYHAKPCRDLVRLGTVDYSYSITWRFNQDYLDAGFTFEPGEIFAQDYKDDEVQCGAV